MQHKMLDQLFAAYFEEERDIGCFDSLSNAAVNAGVFATHVEVSHPPTPSWLYSTSSMTFLFRPRNLVPLYALIATGTLLCL